MQGPKYAPAPPSNGPAVKGLRAPQGVPPPVAPRRLGNCTKLDQRLWEWRTPGGGESPEGTETKINFYK